MLHCSISYIHVTIIYSCFLIFCLYPLLTTICCYMYKYHMHGISFISLTRPVNFKSLILVCFLYITINRKIASKWDKNDRFLFCLLVWLVGPGGFVYESKILSLFFSLFFSLLCQPVIKIYAVFIFINVTSFQTNLCILCTLCRIGIGLCI